MAEAVAKHLSPPKTRIFSAGVRPGQIPAQVYKVMEELGISMSGQSSKGMDKVPLDDIDLVVSFGNAGAECGALPAKTKVEHWPIVNPAPAAGGSAPMLSTFRAGRDAVDRRVFALFLDHWRNVA